MKNHSGQEHSDRIFTVSNGLSFLRILVLAPILYYLHLGALQPEYNLTALALMLAGALTDMLDGWLARKLNQVTNFGRIIDPIADKIGIGIVFLFLAFTRPDFPVWFLIVVVLRDLLIFSIGMIVRIRYRFLFESNMIGKLTVTVLFAYLVVFILKDLYGLETLVTVLLWTGLGFIVLSMISYARRLVLFFGEIREQKAAKDVRK